jgi:hypothetical protein
METTKEKKDFDCVAMKNNIQAKIYAETKGMSVEELLAYFNIPSERDSFKNEYMAVVEPDAVQTHL